MARPILIVADDPDRWPLDVPGVERVTARAYVAEDRYSTLRKADVYNLCRSYRYQSLGYYVSLLAAARGHRPLPSIQAVQDLKSQTILKIAADELQDLIGTSLTPIQSREFVLSVYFGRNVAKRYDKLAGRLFTMFPAPLMRAFFAVAEKSGKWSLVGLRAIGGNEIPEEHRDFVVEAAQEFFAGRRPRGDKRTGGRYDLAILVDPAEAEPPSNERALRRFVRAAEAAGFNTEFITREDFARLPAFDALFIRETTSVNHHTFRFARRAVAEGLIAVDDPDSILKCTNKVFLAELLVRHGVPAPRTLIVHRDNRDTIAAELGLPVILKQPDGSFSQGVVKAEDEAALKQAVAQLLEKSDLIIAQEYLPTQYDWRIGVFDRQPIFACRYWMAKGHWQILKRDGEGVKQAEGGVTAVPVEHAPAEVVRTALKAANLIGDGLYGVDLKQVGKQVYVIEVNDNPNIDAGFEDKIDGDELYGRFMRVLMRRVERRKEGVS